ncbi:MAG: sulfatase-like hydrolase/transferase [Pirellulaceae bacterium]|nr:sulfatase-like hydrolase/transferase [Pirellulaceae bacterium]
MFCALSCTAVEADESGLRQPSGSERKLPNIVLIMADDMGYECVSANGSISYKTPHIDQLAKQGMRFVHAHSQPICTPSRVQIMTGIYNERNYLQFGVLDSQATTFAHLLQQAGYATCVAGKWQLKGGSRAPQHFGFDEHCLWQLTRRPSRYPNPGLEVNGKELDYSNGKYGPELVSDFVCDFIDRHRSEPFFVYYPMILPHWPFEPTPDSADWDPAAKGVLKGVGELKYFEDMVHYTDKIVGKIVSQLDQLGLVDNTMVIFTGDNGTYVRIVSQTVDGPIQGGKGSTRDQGTHVPFVVRWPERVQAGKVSEALIDFTDLLPTLAEAAGIPANRWRNEKAKGAQARLAPQFDGRSFLPVLEGRSDSVRDWIYCWYHRNGRQDLATQHVRDRQYKLYSSGQFFDVVTDPNEEVDLSQRQLSDSQYAAQKRLSTALSAVMTGSRKTPAVVKHRRISDGK